MTNVEFLQAVQVEMAMCERDGFKADSICISSKRRTDLEIFQNILYRNSVNDRRQWGPMTLCGLKVCVSDDLTENEFFIGRIPPQPKPRETAEVVRCKDCKYKGSLYSICCAKEHNSEGRDWFCADGERKKANE